MSNGGNLIRTYTLLTSKQFFITATSLLLAVTVTSCSTKEQKIKNREQKLEDFASSVVQHMFDRNPETYKESMLSLTRDQLSEKTVTKLQSQKIIPDTEIGELKIIDENQDKHLSNKVEVDIVRPVGPIEKDSVPIKVTGKETTLVEGKPTSDKVITAIVTCELTDVMDGAPRAIDVEVLGEPKVAGTEPTKPAPSRRRRRR